MSNIPLIFLARAGRIPSGRVILALAAVLLILFSTGCQDRAPSHQPELVRTYTSGTPDAQGQPPLHVHMTIDRLSATPADRIHLHITADAAGTQYPIFTDKLDVGEQFTIASDDTRQSFQPGKAGSEPRRVVQRSVVLEPFLSGDKTLPAIKIALAGNTGAPDPKVPAILTEPVTIKVASAIPAGIKPSLTQTSGPVDLLPPMPPIWPWAAALGAIALAAIGGLVWWKSRREPRIPIVPPDEALRGHAATLRTLADTPPSVERAAAVRTALAGASEDLRRLLTLKLGPRARGLSGPELILAVSQTRELNAAASADISTLSQELDAALFAPPPASIFQAFDPAQLTRLADLIQAALIHVSPDEEPATQAAPPSPPTSASKEVAA